MTVIEGAATVAVVVVVVVAVVVVAVVVVMVPVEVVVVPLEEPTIVVVPAETLPEDALCDELVDVVDAVDVETLEVADAVTGLALTEKATVVEVARFPALSRATAKAE